MISLAIFPTASSKGQLETCCIAHGYIPVHTSKLYIMTISAITFSYVIGYNMSDDIMEFNANIFIQLFHHYNK